jgi:hypothetical protein
MPFRGIIETVVLRRLMALPLLGLGLAGLKALGPKAFQAGKALVTGGKIPGGLFGQKAIEYGLVVPALSAGANALGLPFGAQKPAAPAVAIGPNAGMSQQQFDRLYGDPGIGVGGFRIPGTGQPSFLEQQNNANRQLQRDLGMGQQSVQRDLGFGQQSTQRDIASMGNDTQRMIAQNQKELGFGQQSTQRQIADFSSRRQLQGMYGGFQRDVAISDRQLAGQYDSNRTQSRIASMYTNLGRYQADRTTENVRISQIAPQLGAIASIYNRRY